MTNKIGFQRGAMEFKGVEYPQDEEVNKAGKKIIWKTFIREANVDTEIYPTLEKYGILPSEMFDCRTFIGEIEEFKDLRTNLERQKKANEMWENLPLSIREKFGNDKNQFIDNGEGYVRNLIKEIEAKEAMFKNPEIGTEIGKIEIKEEVSNG